VAAQIEAGILLRRLQQGDSLGLPHSRPMPAISARVHELRISDETKTWRIFYHVADEAIVILEVMEKKTQQTPKTVIETCRRRLRQYLSS
jgi:phage-related protein